MHKFEIDKIYSYREILDSSFAPPYYDEFGDILLLRAYISPESIGDKEQSVTFAREGADEYRYLGIGFGIEKPKRKSEYEKAIEEIRFFDEVMQAKKEALKHNV